MSNCGLRAVEQMTALKRVSMFTLIHLARDNGVNLYFCKVDPAELVLVSRPAIFHQKDHFVFIENGEPLPPGEYDGYVLTGKPPNEPLPYTLAKKITGSKDVGGLVQPLLTGVAAAVNPLLGAAVGAGLGAARAAGAFGDANKGEWWRVATGGLTGALGASSPTLSAISAAAGEVPGAIKSGNWMAPIGAGLGQYGANVGAVGFGKGFSSAPSGANLFGKIESGIQGGVQALAGGGGGSKVELAPSAVGSTPAGYSGSVTVPGVGSRSLPQAQKLAGLLAGGGQAMPGQATDASGTLGKLFRASSKLNTIGTIASSLLPQPKLEGDIMGNYAKAAQYLGGDNYNALPTATRGQLEKYVNTPLADLANEFVSQDDKGLRQLEERKQQEIDQLMATYANYGQDPYTSSEAQQRLTEVNRQYDQAIAEYQQQIQNQAMNQAIQFKQQMLQNAMQQGNFDYESAMELATYIGRDQEMKYALESKNTEALQQLLAEIFSIGQKPSY